MSMMVSQITSVLIVYSTVCSGVDQRIHQSSMSLSFLRGINWWPVNSPHKGLIMWKMFPFDDIIIDIQTISMHQSSISLAFERGIYWWAVISPQWGLVMMKMFPFDDIIMDIQSINMPYGVISGILKMTLIKGKQRFPQLNALEIPKTYTKPAICSIFFRWLRPWQNRPRPMNQALHISQEFNIQEIHLPDNHNGELDQKATSNRS